MRNSEYSDEYGPMVIGSAQSNSDVPNSEYPAAIIYLPDLSERNGLVCRWVKRQSPEQARECGFRRKR